MEEVNQNQSYDEFTLNFRLEEDVPIDQFEMTMYNYEFEGNRTKCACVALNGERALQFKIPATLPLEQFLRKQLYKDEFLAILANILNQLMYFTENNMPLNKTLLNIHYMYIELSTLDIQLLYLPVNKKFADCNVTEFVQKFISGVRFANQACVDTIEEILKHLDSKLMFDLEDFYHFILKLEQASIDADQNGMLARNQAVQTTSENYSNPVPYLVRLKTNELVPILHKEFMVGKSAECDYQIIDNKRVSRKHAIFRISNGECYVRDNASTNHTFINGQLLQPGVEIMLSNDDNIRMGDEEFKYWVR